MKKIISLAIALMASMGIFAQTNFRSINLEQAISAAKAEKKLVFIDMYTSWCGPCKMMARDVFPQKTVGDFMNEKFVCIKLDAEKEGKDVASTFGIKAYPTFLIVGTDKKEINRLIGYHEANSFINKVKDAMNPNLTPAKMKERYAKGERTPELISAYANYLEEEASLSRDDGKAKSDSVKAMVDAYYNGLSTKQRLDPANTFVYTDYMRSSDSAPFTFILANKKKFKDGQRALIDSLIAKRLDIELNNTLSGKGQYTPSAFARIKKLIEDNGLNKDKKYDEAYKFIETRGQGDLSKYVDYCSANLNKLPKDERSAVLHNFAGPFSKADKTTKKEAALFLRSQLKDLSVMDMYFTISQISLLEKAEE